MVAETKDKNGKPLQITQEELDALLERRERDSKMDPGEKRLRGIIREEIGGVLGEFFTFSDDEDDAGDDKSAGDNDGGFGGVMDFLGLK
jgi:hypothetical protein